MSAKSEIQESVNIPYWEKALIGMRGNVGLVKAHLPQHNCSASTGVGVKGRHARITR